MLQIQDSPNPATEVKLHLYRPLQKYYHLSKNFHQQISPTSRNGRFRSEKLHLAVQSKPPFGNRIHNSVLVLNVHPVYSDDPQI